MTVSFRHATVVIVVEVIDVVSFCGGGQEHQLNEITMVLQTLRLSQVMSHS